VACHRAEDMLAGLQMPTHRRRSAADQPTAEPGPEEGTARAGLAEGRTRAGQGDEVSWRSLPAGWRRWRAGRCRWWTG
jgi:hypothetical protein